MTEGPGALCPNLTPKKEVSQVAKRNLPIGML